MVFFHSSSIGAARSCRDDPPPPPQLPPREKNRVPPDASVPARTRFSGWRSWGARGTRRRAVQWCQPDAVGPAATIRDDRVSVYDYVGTIVGSPYARRGGTVVRDSARPTARPPANRAPPVRLAEVATPERRTTRRARSRSRSCERRRYGRRRNRIPRAIHYVSQYTYGTGCRPDRFCVSRLTYSSVRARARAIYSPRPPSSVEFGISDIVGTPMRIRRFRRFSRSVRH